MGGFASGRFKSERLNASPLKTPSTPAGCRHMRYGIRCKALDSRPKMSVIKTRRQWHKTQDTDIGMIVSRSVIKEKGRRGRRPRRPKNRHAVGNCSGWGVRCQGVSCPVGCVVGACAVYGGSVVYGFSGRGGFLGAVFWARIFGPGPGGRRRRPEGPGPGAAGGGPRATGPLGQRQERKPEPSRQTPRESRRAREGKTQRHPHRKAPAPAAAGRRPPSTQGPAEDADAREERPTRGRETIGEPREETDNQPHGERDGDNPRPQGAERRERAAEPARRRHFLFLLSMYCEPV
jgi:hypothetical protein